MSERVADEKTILDISGDMDVYILAKIKDKLHSLIDANQGRVIINLSQCQYINSTAAGALVESCMKARGVGGDLKLCGLTPFVEKTFSLMGVDKIMSIYSSEEEAASSFA